MLNGSLQLGAGVEFIGEVQFHVRALFELKHDLHVLHAGSRVLGAMEDVMVKHEGIVTKDVLDRMERGVLRKLVLTFTKMELPQTERDRGTSLKESLQVAFPVHLKLRSLVPRSRNETCALLFSLSLFYIWEERHGHRNTNTLAISTT